MSDILETILARKQVEIAALRERIDLLGAVADGDAPAEVALADLVGRRAQGGHVLRGQVQRAGDVGDHATRLDAHDVQDLLARPRRGGDDHVHVAQQTVVVRRRNDLGIGRVLQPAGERRELEERRAGIEQAGEALSLEGTFDYIICHGVYSWVPPQVQEERSARALRWRFTCQQKQGFPPQGRE